MPALPRLTLLARLALVTLGLIVCLVIVLLAVTRQNDQSIVRYVDCRQWLLGEEELQEYLDTPSEPRSVVFREGRVYKVPLVYSEEIKGYVYESPYAPDFDLPKSPSVDAPEVQGSEFPAMGAPEFDWPKFPAMDAQVDSTGVEGYEFLARDAAEAYSRESAMMDALETDWPEFSLKDISEAEWAALPVVDDPNLLRSESRGLFDPELELRGAAKGAARRDGGSTIVAYVNGLPVTKADIEISRLELNWSLEVSRRISTSGGTYEIFLPAGQPTPVPEVYNPMELLKARIERIEQYGVDTALFASVVADLAEFTAATDAGHNCNDADIAALVAQQKTLLAGGKAAEAKGYISAVGEDVYFNEVLPSQFAQQQAVLSWQREIAGDVISPSLSLEWHNAAKDAYLNAHVTLTDDWYMDATLDDVKAYTEEIWALPLAPTPWPPTPTPSASTPTP